MVIASEPISDEPWREIPERSIFAVLPEIALQIDPRPLAEAAAMMIPS